jgi:hypothetical protein
MSFSNPTAGQPLQQAGGRGSAGFSHAFEAEFRRCKDDVEARTLALSSEKNPKELERKKELLASAVAQLKELRAKAHEGSGPGPSKQVVLVKDAKNAVESAEKLLGSL